MSHLSALCHSTCPGRLHCRHPVSPIPALLLTKKPLVVILDGLLHCCFYNEEEGETADSEKQRKAQNVTAVLCQPLDEGIGGNISSENIHHEGTHLPCP